MLIIENIIKAKTSTGIVTLVFDNQVFVDTHERLAVESVIIILILIALRQTAIQIGEDIQSPSPSENGCFGMYHIGQNRYHDST